MYVCIFQWAVPIRRRIIICLLHMRDTFSSEVFKLPQTSRANRNLFMCTHVAFFKAVTIRTKSSPPIDLDLQTSSTPSAAKSHPGLKLCLQTTRTSVDSRARLGCETWQTETTCEPGFRSASPLLVHNGGRDGPLTKRAPVCEDELHPAVFS